MSMPKTLNVHDRERAHHDQWAEETRVADVLVHPLFEAPTAPENRFIVAHMGDLKGKRLLDIGCGLGESSVYFALKDARVTALDISPGMVDFAHRLAAYHGVSIEGLVSPAEILPAPDCSYDLVYIANLIHHVHDRDRLFTEVRRVLKPGGWFYSWDPIAYNPVINVYRRMANEVRSDDETPLTMADANLARRYFEPVNTRMFWIFTLMLFIKYYTVNGIHPNADRYWKRILSETHRSLWWWQPLRGLDALFTRIPGLRYLAWNMVMFGRKAAG
ncbi:class I SAM-dependent methyltransferase [Pseudomonadota bacterium]